MSNRLDAGAGQVSLVQINDQQAKLLFDAALALYQQGDLAAAQSECERLLALRPRYALAWQLMGVMMAQRGDFTAAAETFGVVLKLNPKDAGAHRNRGVALQALKSLEAALRDFDYALALNPAFAEAHFNRGQLLHELGRFTEACSCYQRVTDLDPRFEEAYNCWGNALKELGMLDAALDKYNRALAIRPRFAEAFFNRGTALQRLGREAEAQQSFREAITLNPEYTTLVSQQVVLPSDAAGLQHLLLETEQRIAQDRTDAGALHQRATILERLGRHQEALEGYRAALAIHGDDPITQAKVAQLLVALARYEEAIQFCRSIVTAKPSHALAHMYLGVALVAKDQLQEAGRHYDQAFKLDGANPELHLHRAALWHQVQQYDRALESLDLALAQRSDFAEAHLNRGAVLQALRRYEEAIASFDRGIALTLAGIEHFGEGDRQDPVLKRVQRRLAMAHTDRAVCYYRLGVMAPALAGVDDALAVDPAFALAYDNRGVILQALGRHVEARTSYEHALALEPALVSAHCNLGLCCLLLCDYPSGWMHYEGWRWQPGWSSANTPRPLAAPRWTGAEALEGQTILLYAEQGFGDTLQFCRFVPEVAALGARVIFEVPAPLMPLMQDVPGVDQLLEAGHALPAFDLHAPLVSLPALLKTQATQIPAAVALHLDSQRLTRWAARLGTRTKPRVGLAWSGNPLYLNDRYRAVPLAQLAPILASDCQFISVQKECRVSDREALERFDQLLDVSGDLEDFADTAAVIEQLDLVITVDTSIAHLAATLNKPVWVLLSFNPDWRWQLDRRDSPWYPSVRLYRQSILGQWNDVIDEVARDLAALNPH